MSAEALAGRFHHVTSARKVVFYRDSRACPENFITVSTSQAILRILEIHTTYFGKFLAIISFSGQ